MTDCCCCWIFHVAMVLTSMSNIHWSLCFRAFLCPLSIVIAMERYVHFCLLQNAKQTYSEPSRMADFEVNTWWAGFPVQSIFKFLGVHGSTFHILPTLRPSEIGCIWCFKVRIHMVLYCGPCHFPLPWLFFHLCDYTLSMHLCPIVFPSLNSFLWCGSMLFCCWGFWPLIKPSHSIKGIFHAPATHNIRSNPQALWGQPCLCLCLSLPHRSRQR